MPSGLSRSVASRRSAVEEMLARRLVHGLPDVAREPVGHLLHVGAKRASLLGERPGGIEDSAVLSDAPPRHPTPPRSTRETCASWERRSRTTGRERGHQRFEPVETVHGERRDVAVESMLAKQRARVPELEMRRPRARRAPPWPRTAGDRRRAVGAPPPSLPIAAAATSADATSSPHRRRNAESAMAVLAVSASSGLENCHASGIALATIVRLEAVEHGGDHSPAVTAPIGAEREAK